MKKVSSRKSRREPTAQGQKAIAKIGRAMASNLNLPAIFQEFVGGIKGNIRYDRLVINRVSPGNKITRVFLLPAFEEDTIDHDSVAEQVVREAKPIIRKDSRYERECQSDELLSRMGLRSYIIVPLIHESRVIGSLQVASKRPRAYGRKELHFLVSVAEWLALAMENERLFHETSSLSEKHTELFEGMKRQNEELQKATEYKSQFLARMSHEIRTPLGVLIGFLDILNSETLGPLKEEQKAAVDKMQAQSQRLQKMINDVLSLSRIEEGTIPLEISTFPMQKIIESLRPLADDLQRKNELKVLWDVDPDLPPLRTDAPKLEEILQNLIVNAFKYTPQGEVRIRIKNCLESKSVEFVVEDTGRGISPQNIPKIFEGFHQVDATASSYGVGLGLTIVKKYLELMKGEIEVQSEPGKGSTFTVTLPYTLEV